MKDAHMEKLESNKSELENFKIIVAEAEAFTVMLMKYDQNKESSETNAKIVLKT